MNAQYGHKPLARQQHNTETNFRLQHHLYDGRGQEKQVDISSLRCSLSDKAWPHPTQAQAP